MKRLGSRLLLAVLLAFAGTAGLFWLLSTLIGATGSFDAIRPAPKIEFVRLRRETEVEEKKRVKPQIDKPEPPPTAASVATSEKLSVVPGADMAALAPSLDFSGVGGGRGGSALDLAAGGGVDRDAVPQVRIQPDYPIQARQKKIEGWVEVSFTVAADGSVRDPVVIDADPKQIFDRNAIQAVKGWKYNPKIVDGRPVERADMKVRLQFKLTS